MSGDGLIAAIQETVEKLPGNSYEFSQPIQLRVNELISGVRSDVAIKVFGDDLEVLNAKAAEIGRVLETISGASEVTVEQTTGLPMLQIQIDRERAARLGLNILDVQEMIATATAGRQAGVVFEEDRRFDIAVRLPEAMRPDFEALKRLPVSLPKGTAAGDRRHLRVMATRYPDVDFGRGGIHCVVWRSSPERPGDAFVHQQPARGGNTLV